MHAQARNQGGSRGSDEPPILASFLLVLSMYQCTAVKVNHAWKYFDIRLTAQVH